MPISRLASSVAASVLSLSLLVSGSATGVPTAAPDGRATAGSRGIGDPYWPLDGNGGYNALSYRINNHYTLATKRLRGNTTVTLRTKKALSSLNFDFLLPVSKVTVDGKRAKFSRTAHELRVVPPRALPQGTNHRVRVWYAGAPATKSYAGESNWLANEREVVAMNQPHMAPWWFPANDHPSDKARFDITTTVPRGNQVVSNGHLISKKVNARSATWRWRAKEPMASYLAFFAAGKFTISTGNAYGVRYLNAVSKQLSPADQRTEMRMMNQSARVTAALSRDLGKYPFSITGGLVTGLPVNFALENQTRPTYPRTSYAGIGLVVHELAHQWFGDSVAVTKWRDIWINEGPATFMEWRWTETHGGESAQQTLMSSYNGLAADDPFWGVRIGNPGPAKIFDYAVYNRGAMTLQALRNRIGEQKFWQVMRTWPQSRAGRNGSSAQFEALAERISGQDLTPFFKAWLYSPTKPAKTKANGLA